MREAVAVSKQLVVADPMSNTDSKIPTTPQEQWIKILAYDTSNIIDPQTQSIQ